MFDCWLSVVPQCYVALVMELILRQSHYINFVQIFVAWHAILLFILMTIFCWAWKYGCKFYIHVDVAVPFELSSGPFIFNWLAEWTYYNFILIYYKLSTVGQILFPVSIWDRYSMVFDEDLRTAVQFSVMVFSGLSAAIIMYFSHYHLM